MQHHKLNFLICQDSWLVPFIIQSHPSERQECFLHGCMREGNLFPESCSTGGDRDSLGVPAPGALQKDTSLAKSLAQDPCVAVLRFHDVSPQLPEAECLAGSCSLGPRGADQSPLWLWHFWSAGQHWGANSFAAVSTLRSPYTQEHDAHISAAVPAEWAGIDFKHSAVQEGKMSLWSWAFLAFLFPSLNSRPKAV